MLKGHTGVVYCLDYDPVNRCVFSGGADYQVKGWTIPEEELVEKNLDNPKILSSDKTFPSHRGSIYCLQLEKDMLIAGSLSLDNTIVGCTFDGY